MSDNPGQECDLRGCPQKKTHADQVPGLPRLHLLCTAFGPTDPACQKHHKDLNGVRSYFGVFQNDEREQVDTLQRDGTDDELLSPAIHLSPRWYSSRLEDQFRALDLELRFWCQTLAGRLRDG